MADRVADHARQYQEVLARSYQEVLARAFDQVRARAHWADGAHVG